MRFGRIALAGLLVTLALADRASAAVIRDYAVDLRLNPDGTLAVTETITVDFGAELKHGIYRRIPVLYERAAGAGVVRVPAHYAIRLRLTGISDAQGAGYQYQSRRDGRYLVIRIGDPDRYVSGVMTYRISYDVARAINYFDQSDELYWNVTGNEWEWPIQRVACNIQLPPGASASSVRYRTFTGYYGATGNTAAVQGRDNVLAVAAQSLNASEGLTVVVGLPKGVLRPPNALEDVWWFVQDNGLMLAALLIPLLAFVTLLGLYLRHGRDPDVGSSVAVQYKPPENLAPAELGTLVDERADIADIVSTVLDLAVRGYLQIREIESTVFFMFQSKDYEFVKRKEFLNDPNLQHHERRFLEALFGASDTVRLSDLKNRFYTSLPLLRDAIYGQLVGKHLFPANPEKVRQVYVVCGIGAVILTALLVMWHLGGGGALAGAGVVPPQLLLFTVPLVTGLGFWGFSRAMPRKTRQGALAARHALGFKEFVVRVEKDRIARMADEDPTVFERLLPFALVLGAADTWAQKFRDLALPPPSWYVSPDFSATRFNTVVFVQDLGGGMRSMASTFASSPSGGGAGGGSSGFGGGGGFSGGGFGGGGGGGW